MINLLKSLCPFVLKSTAIEALKAERIKGDERVINEQTRIVFMKLDELFKDLGPIERSRLSQVNVAGIVLIDENLRPAVIRSFSKVRSVVVGDEFNIKIDNGIESVSRQYPHGIWKKALSPKPHRHDEDD